MHRNVIGSNPIVIMGLSTLIYRKPAMNVLVLILIIFLLSGSGYVGLNHGWAIGGGAMGAILLVVLILALTGRL